MDERHVALDSSSEYDNDVPSRMSSPGGMRIYSTPFFFEDDKLFWSHVVTPSEAGDSVEESQGDLPVITARFDRTKDSLKQPRPSDDYVCGLHEATSTTGIRQEGTRSIKRQKLQSPYSVPSSFGRSQ